MRTRLIQLAMWAVAAIVTVIGLGMAPSSATAPTAESAQASYVYDAPIYTTPGTASASERGPPSADYDETTYDAVDRWSHGASAGLEGPQPGSTSTNTAHALFMHAVSRTTQPDGQAQVADGVRSSLARSNVAAKSADEAVDAYTHSYKYHPRIRQRGLEDPRAHNFPYSFDDVILRQKPTTQADGSLLYRKVGEINGKSGTYEIAVNPDTGVIFHRSWKP